MSNNSIYMISEYRNLLSNQIKNAKFDPNEIKWRKVFWEKDSVEPAILRVPLVIFLFLLLWGLNIWLLEKFKIPFHPVIKGSAPTSFIMTTAIALLVIYTIIITVVSTLSGLNTEFAITLFYSVLLVTLFLPIPGYEIRNTFFRLLKIVFIPNSIITFSEVLLADALTSLSKIFKDISVTGLIVYCYFRNENIIDYHNIGIICIALLSSLPFWLRVRQCYVQLIGCPDHIARIPVILNLLKYCSAFPAIWLAASQGLGYHHPYLLSYMNIAATINSLYSYSWDIIMDWGFLTITRTGKIYPRTRLYYHWSFYLFSAILNLILRFSWKFNRFIWFNSLSSATLVLVLELIEICRRSLWNMIRIEWEVIVQQDKEIQINNEKMVYNKNDLLSSSLSSASLLVNKHDDSHILSNKIHTTR